MIKTTFNQIGWDSYEDEEKFSFEKISLSDLKIKIDNYLEYSCNSKGDFGITLHEVSYKLDYIEEITTQEKAQRIYLKSYN